MNLRPLAVSMLAALLLLPLVASADDDDDDEDHERHQEGPRAPALAAVKLSPLWKPYAAECGSCHLAYAPGMLPARSWKALLGGLADHFGQNAELDAPTRTQLEAFLAANAGPEVPGATPLRITALPAWLREHRELSPAVYSRKAILTPANCAACHPGANEGAFGEHQVKIPRDAPAAR